MYSITCRGDTVTNNSPDKYMREWLSWWSTTLPRSGSRVRVPSRALIKLYIDDVFQIRSTKTCASGSVGGARPCQGRGRGFESRLALSKEQEKDIRMDILFLFSSPRRGSKVRGLRSASVFADYLRAPYELLFGYSL